MYFLSCFTYLDQSVIPTSLKELSKSLSKELTLKFSIAYLKDDFQFTLDMMEQGRMNPSSMITEQIGLESLPKTFELLKNDKSQCKVMICPGH